MDRASLDLESLDHVSWTSTTSANKHYSSASHHEQKNQKTIGQIKLSSHNKTTNKTSLMTFSMYININV